MSVLSLLTWLAALAGAAVVARPGRATWLVAGGACAIAAGARQVHLDPAAVPLVVAAALCLHAGLSRSAERALATLALLLVVAALLAPPGRAALAPVPAALAVTAGVFAIVALAAALRRPAWLGFVVAILPFPAGVVAPAHADLAVALPGGVGQWGAREGLSFAASTWPAWADLVWQLGPWLCLTYALAVWARPTSWRPALAFLVAALGASAVAQLLAVTAAVGAGTASVVLGDTQGLPAPTQSAAALSGLGGAVVAARVVALVLWARWRSSAAADTTDVDLSPWATVCGAGLLTATAALAPAWYGPGWASDPAVFGVLLGLGAGAAIAARVTGPRVSDALHAALALAAVLVVGGGVWGWRVAGVVFGS